MIEETFNMRTTIMGTTVIGLLAAGWRSGPGFYLVIRQDTVLETAQDTDQLDQHGSTRIKSTLTNQQIGGGDFWFLYLLENSTINLKHKKVFVV